MLADTIAAEAEIEAELEALIAEDEEVPEELECVQEQVDRSPGDFDSESELDDDEFSETSSDLINGGEDFISNAEALQEHRQIIGTLSRKFSTLSRLNPHDNLPESFMPAEPLPPFPKLSNSLCESDNENDDDDEFLDAIGRKINFSVSELNNSNDELFAANCGTLKFDKNQPFPKVGNSSTEFQIKEHMILQEILTSEVAYETDLQVMIHHFVGPLLKMSRRQTITPVYQANDITPHQVDSMLSNIQEIAEFHKSFLKELQKPENLSASGFCNVFYNSVEKFQMYTKYVINYPKSLKSVNALQRNKNFISFVESKQKYGRGGLDFLSFLSAPVHRIPDYVSLLTELLKENEAHASFRWCAKLQATVDQLMEIVTTFNSCNRRLKDDDVIQFQIWRMNAIRKNTECILEIDITTKSITFRKASSMQKYAQGHADDLVLAPQEIIDLKLSSKNKKKCTFSYFGKHNSSQAFQVLFLSPSERERFFRLFNIHISSAIKRPKPRRDMSICASEYRPKPLKITQNERKALPLKKIQRSFKQCKLWKENCSSNLLVEAFIGSMIALGFSINENKENKSGAGNQGSVDENGVPNELRQFGEFIAECMHDAWADQKLREGWKFCPSFNPEKLKHPNLLPYNELAKEEKLIYHQTTEFLMECLTRCNCSVNKNELG